MSDPSKPTLGTVMSDGLIDARIDELRRIVAAAEARIKELLELKGKSAKGGYDEPKST